MKAPTGRKNREKTPEQALTSLMALCSRAEKSGADALRLMRGWGISDADSRRILERLVSDRFIDDERFARAYVREKVTLSGWGPHKIRQMLLAKGIPAATIAAAMVETAGKDVSGNLARIMERKARTVRYADRYDLKNKLVRFGLSRGFDYDEVVERAENIARQLYEK